MNLRYLIALFLVIFTLPLKADIMIKDAIAVTSTPKSKSGAIFMIIHNNSQNIDRLLSAQTGVSKMAQMHSSEMDGDVMKMVHVEEGFEVPSHGRLTLEPGGKHIMLMGLSGTLEKDSYFNLILEFENTGQIEVEVKYEGSIKDMKKMDHSHDH
ncbi:MAG: copper chaperone PCu(A)C [Paracoccaceae bacterium]|nr:copper chaperone PCu(A)C [Paracoccaceae bacterium]